MAGLIHIQCVFTLYNDSCSHSRWARWSVSHTTTDSFNSNWKAGVRLTHLQSLFSWVWHWVNDYSVKTLVRMHVYFITDTSLGTGDWFHIQHMSSSLRTNNKMIENLQFRTPSCCQYSVCLPREAPCEPFVITRVSPLIIHKIWFNFHLSWLSFDVTWLTHISLGSWEQLRKVCGFTEDLDNVSQYFWTSFY